MLHSSYDGQHSHCWDKIFNIWTQSEAHFGSLYSWVTPSREIVVEEWGEEKLHNCWGTQKQIRLEKARRKEPERDQIYSFSSTPHTPFPSSGSHLLIAHSAMNSTMHDPVERSVPSQSSYLPRSFLIQSFWQLRLASTPAKHHGRNCDPLTLMPQKAQWGAYLQKSVRDTIPGVVSLKAKEEAQPFICADQEHTPFSSPRLPVGSRWGTQTLLSVSSLKTSSFSPWCCCQKEA